MKEIKDVRLQYYKKIEWISEIKREKKLETIQRKKLQNSCIQTKAI